MPVTASAGPRLICKKDVFNHFHDPCSSASRGHACSIMANMTHAVSLWVLL